MGYLGPECLHMCAHPLLFFVTLSGCSRSGPQYQRGVGRTNSIRNHNILTHVCPFPEKLYNTTSEDGAISG
ncbi:hypothetical protein B0F90DRAFT_1710076 [Multifurca ochricompacta]|uniref:Secreted protein n=1 Tax=Multifurca ochricompacta TaxID=376703 RepID=A0AAD4M822_9AGAM|nr:hypothetical protein B0F90DRAFT_1710076 [Multifurca ochricompacta]